MSADHHLAGEPEQERVALSEFFKELRAGPEPQLIPSELRRAFWNRVCEQDHPGQTPPCTEPLKPGTWPDNMGETITKS